MECAYWRYTDGCLRELSYSVTQMMHDCRLLLLKILVALYWVSRYDFKCYIVLKWLEFIVRLCFYVLFCFCFV